MLTERILATFPSTSSGSLPQACDALLLQQQSSWQQLADGIASLKEIQVREVRVGDDAVFVHFNPRRIVSTAAKVDPKSVGERKCFLCAENLPPEEKGILYREEFLILCNPMPILERHLTIAHVKHISQGIEGYVSVFIELARAMSPGYSVFYNGPKCGASAPDHKHFQAGPVGNLPIERVAADTTNRRLRLSSPNAALFSFRYAGLQVLAIEGDDAGNVGGLFSRLLVAMREVSGQDEEPKVNLLSSYSYGAWRMIVFPRQKHRPDAFFRNGDDQILISPAATDVGGILVTPRETDFSRMDGKTIQGIFDEVMLDESTVEKIIEAL